MKKWIDAANYVAELGVEAKQTNKNTHYIMVVVVVVVVEGLGPSLRCWGKFCPNLELALPKLNNPHLAGEEFQSVS